jgi:predicted AlkP superfamily pyrophosphatase or phosphodiesterase
MRPTALCCLLLLSPALLAAPAPRLVLQITVDQLRGDLPARHMSQFGANGFRWLYENGTAFHDAHHAHANTETIVGHTTLATGAHPAVHGMVGNLWYDRETGMTTYNVEDPNYQLLTADADVSEDTEIDPTQRAARSEGRSPAAILVTTLSDELRLATAGRAKSIGISVKDRGAIAMAGHSGTAYWFSKASGTFVTSSYYESAYPNWVKRFNDSNPAQRYANTTWELLGSPREYLFGDADDRDWEADIAGFGRTFPHPYGDGSSPYFNTLLTLSPAGDELVLDFALQAITHEGLGADAITDYLSVSFSSTDYVGHVFGPSSLEAEDNLLRLDRTLARLLQFIDERIGLENTLVVLSADHGAPDAPGTLKSLGIPADYVDPAQWETEAPVQRIKTRFGIEGRLIEAFHAPYLYLSEEARSAVDGETSALEAAVAAEMMRLDGVALAVSSRALASGQTPDTALHRAALRNFHRERSGDIFVVFAPNHFINDFDGLTVASTHGSPWPYDTFVPLVFAGTGIRPQQVYRSVQTVDIAPTLAALLGIKAPSGAAGVPLEEVFRP